MLNFVMGRGCWGILVNGVNLYPDLCVLSVGLGLVAI